MGIRTRVAIVGVMFMTAVATAADPPAIDDAIKQAGSEHKPLVIEVGAEWCEPCKKFDASVLPDQRVQAVLNDVVFVQYDADESRGAAVVARYSVASFPTFLVVDSKGVEVSRRS